MEHLPWLSALAALQSCRRLQSSLPWCVPWSQSLTRRSLPDFSHRLTPPHLPIHATLLHCSVTQDVGPGHTILVAENGKAIAREADTPARRLGGAVGQVVVVMRRGPRGAAVAPPRAARPAGSRPAFLVA